MSHHRPAVPSHHHRKERPEVRFLPCACSQPFGNRTYVMISEHTAVSSSMSWLASVPNDVTYLVSLHRCRRLCIRYYRTHIANGETEPQRLSRLLPCTLTSAVGFFPFRSFCRPWPAMPGSFHWSLMTCLLPTFTHLQECNNLQALLGVGSCPQDFTCFTSLSPYKTNPCYSGGKVKTLRG